MWSPHKIPTVLPKCISPGLSCNERILTNATQVITKPTHISLSHTRVITHIRKQLLFNYSPHSPTHSGKGWAFDSSTFPQHLRFTLHTLRCWLVSVSRQPIRALITITLTGIPARFWATEIVKGKAMFINYYFTWNIIEYFFLKKRTLKIFNQWAIWSD